MLKLHLQNERKEYIEPRLESYWIVAKNGWQTLQQ